MNNEEKVTIEKEEINRILFGSSSLGSLLSATRSVVDAKNDLIRYSPKSEYALRLKKIQDELTDIATAVTEDVASELGLLDTGSN